MSMIKYLGDIGRELPDLTSEEWKKIFEFIELFLSTENVNESDINFNWGKIRDILDLLNKVK